MKTENGKWKTVRLGDVCEIVMGTSPTGETISNNSDLGIEFHQGKTCFGNTYLNKSNLYTSAPIRFAEAGNVIMSIRAPVGDSNITPRKIAIGRGLCTFNTADSFERIYLFYYLNSQIEYLKSKSTGSTFKAISKDVIADLKIPLPPLAEQKHTAAVLDKCTALIAKHKLMLEKYDTLVKSRFIEMFGDIIQNTKNWELKSFTEIAKSRLGKMLDSKKQTGKEKYPYLANFNVQWFRFNLENLNEMDFSEADRIEFALKDGDLLVCEGGEVGRCAVWHNQIENCFFQKAVHRVRLNMDLVHPDYMAYWFKFRSDFNSFDDIVGSKATIAHLTGEKLKLLKIPVPPLELQNDFAAFVQQIDKSKFAVQKSLEKTEILYKSLMQTYFG